MKLNFGTIFRCHIGQLVGEEFVRLGTFLRLGYPSRGEYFKSSYPFMDVRFHAESKVN